LLRSKDIVPFLLGNDILATAAESLASYLEKIAKKLDASDLANVDKVPQAEAEHIAQSEVVLPAGSICCLETNGGADHTLNAFANEPGSFERLHRVKPMKKAAFPLMYQANPFEKGEPVLKIDDNTQKSFMTREKTISAKRYEVDYPSSTFWSRKILLISCKTFFESALTTSRLHDNLRCKSPGTKMSNLLERFHVGTVHKNMRS
jgi:hypothetical protein